MAMTWSVSFSASRSRISGWIAIGPQSGRSEQRAFKAMRRILAQHPARRPGSIGQMIRHVVQIALNAVGIFQPAQLPQFCWSQAESRGGGSHVQCSVYGKRPATRHLLGEHFGQFAAAIDHYIRAELRTGCAVRSHRSRRRSTSRRCAP